MSIRTILSSACILSLIAVFVSPPLVHSTTMVKFTEQDLAIEADLIIQGRVTSTWTEWGENNRYIYTFGRVEVDRVIKGYVDNNEFIVKRPGGSIGSTTMEAFGTATFQVGDELILFLLDDMSYESNVLGWEQGRFNVVDGSVVQNGKTVEDFIAGIESNFFNEK